MSARLLENGIEMIEFLGRVVGKALYEGILLDYSFSLVFVQKLLGRYSFLDELSTLDSELYRNLMYLKVRKCCSPVCLKPCHLFSLNSDSLIGLIFNVSCPMPLSVFASLRIL